MKIEAVWTMENLQYFIAQQPGWLQSILGLAVLIMAAAAANYVIKSVLLRAAAPYLDQRGKTDDKVAARLANVIPALIISNGIEFVPHLPIAAVTVIQNITSASIVLSVALAVSAALDYANELYQFRPDADLRPIKGYLQLLKILLYIGGGILIISALLEQSPLLLLSGLGAMAAVLLLVFKDTILSLVASVQLTSNDMLRVGDWIEMPQLNADGDVVDIALHTVKVQNWDKTITTIPTHRLIAESYKNWRGMSESGGRRIMRTLLIDQNSIDFLEMAEIEQLRRFKLLDSYLVEKESELGDWNNGTTGDGTDRVNARRLTNVGSFRAYIVAYLKNHERITKDMTLMVRQHAPTPQGLPLEIYCFTNTTAWGEYEDIQSDLFDHLLAILPEFGLHLYQEPSGLDFQGFVSREKSA